jgi:hypothetical protein
LLLDLETASDMQSFDLLVRGGREGGKEGVREGEREGGREGRENFETR